METAFVSTRSINRNRNVTLLFQTCEHENIKFQSVLHFVFLCCLIPVISHKSRKITTEVCSAYSHCIFDIVQISLLKTAAVYLI